MTASASRRAPRRTQAERTALSEDRLMAAALKLVAERGYERTSLQAIGDAAGYSRGLVSHRFGSKEGLLWAMFERTFSEWRTERLLPRVGARVGVEALHAVVAASRAALQGAPDTMRGFYAMLFESVGALEVLRPKVAEFHRRQRKGLAAWIAAGIAAGNVRADTDAVRAAELFTAMLRGAAYQWLLDPRGVDIERLHDAIDESVTRLWSSGAAARRPTKG
jgi:AcrR family transcriptional regulator